MQIASVKEGWVMCRSPDVFKERVAPARKGLSVRYRHRHAP
jgi:hypothetical protein